MLNDQQTRAMAYHPLRLGQDNFDKARVLVDLSGQCDGLFRRRYIGNGDNASLGLRDDLLCHHQDVAVLQAGPVFPKSGDSNRPEIIPGPYQRDPLESHHCDPGGGHCYPSLARSKGNTCSA